MSLKSPAEAQTSFSASVTYAVELATRYLTLTAVSLLPMRETVAVPLLPSLNGPKLVESK